MGKENEEVSKCNRLLIRAGRNEQGEATVKIDPISAPLTLTAAQASRFAGVLCLAVDRALGSEADTFCTLEVSL